MVVACGAAPPLSPNAAPPAPCTSESLQAFDPGAPVSARSILPPVEQRSTVSREHIVEVTCRPDEADEDCQSRVEEQAARRYPGAALSSAISWQRQLVRAQLAVDGTVTEVILADLPAVEEHLAELRAKGRQVALVGLDTVPDRSAARLAVARAEVQGAVIRQAALRLELVLGPIDDSLRTLLEVQRLARQAGFRLLAWVAEDDGSLRLEVGCTVRPDTP